jgi:chemotaxis protein MotD
MEVSSTGTTGSAAGALKVLHLQLEPADLGVVTVRVALKDQAISLHLEASHLDTARVIERDREVLANALKSAGYLVDGITSQPAEAPRLNAPLQQAMATDGQSAFSSSPQSQSGMPHSRGEGGSHAPRYPHDNGLATGPGVNEGRGGASQGASGALYV